jgi:hypothetical protein
MKLIASEEEVPDDFKKLGDSHDNDLLELFFHLQPLNIDKIEANMNDEAVEVKYTKEEIDALQQNPEGRERLLGFLDSVGATITTLDTASTNEAIKAIMSIAKWEVALDTQFYEYEKINENINMRINRCSEYYLPVQISDDLLLIYGSTQFPVEPSLFDIAIDNEEMSIDDKPKPFSKLNKNNHIDKLISKEGKFEKNIVEGVKTVENEDNHDEGALTHEEVLNN